jgi:hypothetical protein
VKSSHASSSDSTSNILKMTAGTPFPAEAQPYAWDNTQAPPPESLKLWTEVGNGIDKSQTGECSIWLLADEGS